jgi:GNAT superfamily N-acetyltransferase
MAAVSITPASPADLPALAGIERAAARLFPPEDLAPALAETTVPAATLEEARASGRLFVARLGDRPVGFLVACLLDGEPFIIELDVLPEHHRRGLGSALVRAIVGWAGARGLRGVTLTTFRHLPFNAPFYAKLGFVELPPAEQGPQLRARLAEEAEQGLDPAKRVAMRLRLAPPGG